MDIFFPIVEFFALEGYWAFPLLICLGLSAAALTYYLRNKDRIHAAWRRRSAERAAIRAEQEKRYQALVKQREEEREARAAIDRQRQADRERERAALLARQEESARLAAEEERTRRLHKSEQAERRRQIEALIPKPPRLIAAQRLMDQGMPGKSWIEYGIVLILVSILCYGATAPIGLTLVIIGAVLNTNEGNRRRVELAQAEAEWEALFTAEYARSHPLPAESSLTRAPAESNRSSDIPVGG